MVKIDFTKSFDCVDWDLSWISFMQEVSVPSGAIGFKWSFTPPNVLFWWMVISLITIIAGEASSKVILSPLFCSFWLLMSSTECSPQLHNGVPYQILTWGALSSIRSLLFANETLIFYKVSIYDITNLKLILYLFEDVSGLGINFAKSSLIYFGKYPNKGHFLAPCLDCTVDTLPVKHLGVPIKYCRLNKRDWQPLLDKLSSMQALTTWKNKLLLVGDRVTLVNYLLTALPYFIFPFKNFHCGLGWELII